MASSPFAASISRSVSAGDSARGSVRPRRGSVSAAAGFSARAPMRTRWRKYARTAETRREIVDPASPSARIPATQRSRSSTVASATGPPRKAPSAARSRL